MWRSPLFDPKAPFMVGSEKLQECRRMIPSLGNDATSKSTEQLTVRHSIDPSVTP
jgi:hypothetical protein